MQQITIKIAKGGKINLDVAGIKGGSCKDITKALEKALGMSVETKDTSEMYEEEQKVEQTQGLGGQDW